MTLVTRRRRRKRSAWPAWAQTALEATALLAAALIAVIAALGGLGGWLGGRGPLAQLLAFAGAVLALGVAATTLLRGWLAARPRLARRLPWSPAALAALLALGGLWFATGPLFQAEVAIVRLWLGGSAEAHRQGLAHQVYAAYRRADPDALLRVLERARVSRHLPTKPSTAATHARDAKPNGVGAPEGGASRSRSNVRTTGSERGGVIMAKRGPNEGSIHKRKDGRWVGVINLGYQDGKRRRKYVYGDTRGAVQERFTAALRTHQQHLPVVGERETTAHFLKRWLEESVKPTVRPPTYRSYEQLVRLHIAPDLGRIPLAKLSPRDIQGLINFKLTTGLSPRTVQYVHAVLRHALAQALRWGLVARNAGALVDAPRVRRLEVTPFNPEQAHIFLNAAKGDRLEALFSVALAVGLRQGEALGLRWEDLDLDKGDLRVRFALQRVAGKLKFVEPKTTRSRRTIALPEVIVASLRAHRARQLREKMLAGSRWQEASLVFTTPIGTPLDGRNVTKHFQKLAAKAGLPVIKFKDLRHTAASLLLAQSVHPRVVMEILGHSQIKLTMDTYSHVIPALQREAASKIDVVLRRSL